MIYSGKSSVFGYLFSNENVPENCQKEEAKAKKRITSKQANKKFNKGKEPQGLKKVSASYTAEHGIKAFSSRRTKEEASALLSKALQAL